MASEMCEEENINILENIDLYIHQYLTAIFQINIRKTISLSSSSDDTQILCLNLRDLDVDDYFSFSNYSHYVFENLMNQNIEKVSQFINKRFLSDRSNLFSSSYRVFEDDSNRIAYLFNCYCRLEFVKDFANLISIDDKKKLKRYIIDQVALILVCPYVNVRYTENPSITPFTDLFKVLTQNIPWPSEYLTFVKKFFVDVTDAIHNAKNGTIEIEENYTSSLVDLSPEELDLTQIIKPIYDQLCKKFKDDFLLSSPFVDNVKFVSILLTSPMLAEIFIDLNCPPKLKNVETTQTNNETTGQNNPSNNSNDLFRSFLMNTLSSLDIPMNNVTSTESSAKTEKFFHESLLGILLCNSPLPSPFSLSKENNMNFLFNVFQNSEYEYPFFVNPTTKSPTEIERIELDIDENLVKLRSSITDLFLILLKSSTTVRIKTLKWIECCLATFNNRSKMWTNELMALIGGNSGSNVSDGFMLNFSAVLLNLCKPFCQIPDSSFVTTFASASEHNPILVNQKMLKVDPIYVGYSKSKVRSEADYKPYLDILNQESVLINFDSKLNSNSSNSNESKEEIDFANYQPNFITKCFFSTHKALHLGFRVIHERFTAISQENNQIQRRFESLGLTTMLQYMVRDNLTPPQQETLQRLDHNMTVTLSMKSALVETNFFNLLFEFYLASAVWINNLAVCETEGEAAHSFQNLESILNGSRPIPHGQSKCLKWIPEFLIENIIDFMLFLRYFEVKPKILTLKSDLEPLITMLVLFMGSQNRMRNPHLRAKMAEMLEALLPPVQQNIQS